jgi:phenylpropionate dioxygenase-like ring-hydroxylating dioxygenase large terminal subunit
MFKNFANVWTMVGQGRDLKAHEPLGLRVGGEPVVLFRDASGKAAALVDRCPHRGVALSLGQVRNGEIECPFHGWRFDATGANCRVPWNPDAKREKLGAIALPLREIAGLLWLYTGFEPERSQTPEPAVSETLFEPHVTVCAQSVLWRAHWTRVMENMLDMPHLPFVHRKTIGKTLRGLAESRMDLSWEDRPFGGRITNRVDGVARPGALEYRFPNVMELFIDPPGKRLRLMVACIPEDETTTRLLLLTIRDFARWPVLNPIFRIMNRRIANEDRAIVESSQPREVPPPGAECSVRTDAPTLAFRRIYRAKLLGSFAPERSRVHAEDVAAV